MLRLKESAMKATYIHLLCALAFLGCAEENVNWGNPTKVCEAPDGACWEWNCESDGCLPGFTDEIDPAGLPDCATGEGPYASWGNGRFLEIYAFCDESPDDGMWASTAADGRLLLCEEDADCPQSKPSNLNECVQGLCQNKDTDLYPRNVITTSDAEALCFAGFNRAETVNDIALVSSVFADIDAACSGDWNEPCEGELPDYCWTVD
jgi:hypothetical protein